MQRFVSRPQQFHATKSLFGYLSGVLGGLLCLLLAATAESGQPDCPPIARDPCCHPPCGAGQVWMVSSLHAPKCSGFEPSLLEFFRWECGEGWQPSSREEFLAADDPQVSTGFFFDGFLPSRHPSHAKIIEHNTKALWKLYARVAPCDRPFRLVLWSWPSQGPESTRLIGDARSVSQRADRHGLYLAWLIDQMNPDVPVGILGYSLGAQPVTGGLQVLGGGELSGQGLPERLHPDRRPPSVALLGGAMPHHWLWPGHRHGMAVSAVEQMLLTVNSRERTLRIFRRLRIMDGSSTLGNVGISRRRLGEYSDRVTQFWTEPYNGPRHFFKVYMSQPAVTSRLTPYLFPLPELRHADDAPVEPASAAAAE